MTISVPISRTGGSRMRSVTFTHASIGSAAENATTSFKISGRILRYATTGGDAVWTFTLNDGVADIFASGNLNGNDHIGITSMSTTIPHRGIPICGTLKLTTGGVATTVPVVTIYWEEDI